MVVVCCRTGYLQTAARFLLQASEFNLPEFCLQKAKWHWEKVGDVIHRAHYV